MDNFGLAVLEGYGIFDTHTSLNLIGEAESGLERLHKCAEKDMHAFLPITDKTESSLSLQDFSEFRVRLAGLTRYCRDIFNLDISLNFVVPLGMVAPSITLSF